jgi:hypothetical protein
VCINVCATAYAGKYFAPLSVDDILHVDGQVVPRL